MASHEHLARPYDIDLPVRYRGVHGQEWRTGATVSVSRTEIVFRTADSRTPDPDVELVVELTPSSEMQCAARVMRVERDGSGAVVTATVDGYRFQKCGAQRSRANAVVPSTQLSGNGKD